METEYTNIRVTYKLQKALKEMGKKGESYEDVIWRVLKKDVR